MNRSAVASIGAVLLIITQPAFSQQMQQVKNPAAFSMRGAYDMTRQVFNLDGKDSIFRNNQYKLFTDKHVMFAHKRTQDSLAEYGIGTYTIDNGKVRENIFFSHNGAQNDTFELAIDKTGNGYSQVIHFPGNEQWKKIVLIEEYKTVGSKIKSPLDGAWKQTKFVSISKDGKQTVTENPTQFKLYESGAFMWAGTIKEDATKEATSYYGYGLFELASPNELIETNTSSTFATGLIGGPMKVDIKMLDNDNYEQTIREQDGSIMVETYTRLK